MQMPAVPAADTAFQSIPDIVRRNARADPSHLALVCGNERISYGQLDILMDRVAASLQRDGLAPGDVIAICANTSVRYGAVFLGALRAGLVVAPLAQSSTAAQLAAMLADAKPRLLFADDATAGLVAATRTGAPCIALQGEQAGRGLEDWLMPEGV